MMCSMTKTHMATLNRKPDDNGPSNEGGMWGYFKLQDDILRNSIDIAVDLPEPRIVQARFIAMRDLMNTRVCSALTKTDTTQSLQSFALSCISLARGRYLGYDNLEALAVPYNPGPSTTGETVTEETNQPPTLDKGKGRATMPDDAMDIDEPQQHISSPIPEDTTRVSGTIGSSRGKQATKRKKHQSSSVSISTNCYE